MVAVDGHGEVTSADSAVDLRRPLEGPLPAEDLKLEHGLDLAPAMEAVDLRRAGGSGARRPRLHWIQLVLSSLFFSIWLQLQQINPLFSRAYRKTLMLKK